MQHVAEHCGGGAKLKRPAFAPIEDRPPCDPATSTSARLPMPCIGPDRMKPRGKAVSAH
jgi:hypothetical protein